MKITNTTGLPHIIEEWAAYDNYQRGTAEFTTTELLQPERVLALKRKHRDEIEVDVTDLAWRMSGQAKHVVFQHIAEQNPDRYITEERYTMAVAGTTISGQLDLYDKEEQVLYDYKESQGLEDDPGGRTGVDPAGQHQRLPVLPHRELPGEAHEKHRDLQRLVDADGAAGSQISTATDQGMALERWDHQKTLQYIQKRVALASGGWRNERNTAALHHRRNAGRVPRSGR